MMNVRAYFPDNGEYLYPTSTKLTDIIEFYSYLEGYRLKNREFVIEKGSGIVDVSNIEIFENDWVNVYFYDDKSQSIDECEMEIMKVTFELGCFCITNKDDMIFDLGNFFVDEEDFLISVRSQRNADEEIEV